MTKIHKNKLLLIISLLLLCFSGENLISNLHGKNNELVKRLSIHCEVIIILIIVRAGNFLR